MTNAEYIEIFRKNRFNVQKISKELNVSLQEVRNIFSKMYKSEG